MLPLPENTLLAPLHGITGAKCLSTYERLLSGTGQPNSRAGSKNHYRQNCL